MCIFDLTILWGVAGSALGFMGYRIYKSYQDSKQNPYANTDTNDKQHSISAK